MASVPRAVAACRLAVRRVLSDLPKQALVLAACSGGADSLALASATAFVAVRRGQRAGLVTVDHGLQVGSADRAADVAAWGIKIGLAPTVVVAVEVAGRPGGPEAAAREARYEALAGVARRVGAAAVLLGHTREDQAETVLLALARGAGPRGIAGMPVRREVHGVTFLRPYLDLPRRATRDACAELGLTPWEDPHNRDVGYARARVRAALPLLSGLLGPDTVSNLARTARLVASDLTALDELAERAEEPATNPDGSLHVPALAGLPAALRTRILRRYALALGAAGAALSATHIDALEALVTGWHGQGPVALPGGLRVARHGDRITRE